MIEARQLFPGTGGVAGLATGRTASRSYLLHALPELATMRVGVAIGASQALPVVNG